MKALTDGNGPPKELKGTVIEVETEADAVCVNEVAAMEAQAEIDVLDAIDGGNVGIEIEEVDAEYFPASERQSQALHDINGNR